jgi:hypothetical protein
VPADVRVTHIYTSTLRIDQVRGGACTETQLMAFKPALDTAKGPPSHDAHCHGLVVCWHPALLPPLPLCLAMHMAEDGTCNCSVSARVHTPKRTQSLLTGESVAVDKHVEAVAERNAVVQDKTCIMFSVRSTGTTSGMLS